MCEQQAEDRVSMFVRQITLSRVAQFDGHGAQFVENTHSSQRPRISRRFVDAYQTAINTIVRQSPTNPYPTTNVTLRIASNLVACES